MLLSHGVPGRVAVDIPDRSSVPPKHRCMHVTELIRRDVVDQLNQYFWKST